ncbi:hypothetical protein CBR_g55239 [Chara braunii]|uniref:Uncharacterized protein n=1 Tax=Chara braunii TaxID=69332 RepID=A0A388MCR5_CHABU|nr:hypothetical protein CBR_g55239 [Chara braunii]|eukprot:GBG92358.1 hypothetical protein CBR_g55239 [Chara braunii]
MCPFSGEPVRRSTSVAGQPPGYPAWPAAATVVRPVFGFLPLAAKRHEAGVAATAVFAAADSKAGVAIANAGVEAAFAAVQASPGAADVDTVLAVHGAAGGVVRHSYCVGGGAVGSVAGSAFAFPFAPAGGFGRLLPFGIAVVLPAVQVLAFVNTPVVPAVTALGQAWGVALQVGLPLACKCGCQRWAATVDSREGAPQTTTIGAWCSAGGKPLRRAVGRPLRVDGGDCSVRGFPGE